ncbi:SBE3 [Symbiodinium microadriaticum]|nr:SBE3 [Symbiodinium microadriaticum]
MTYTSDIRMFDAVVHPVPSPKPSKRPAKVPGERIYECHLGLTGHKQFKQAAEVVIPRAKRNGYTALLLIGVQALQEWTEMGDHMLIHMEGAKSMKPCAYFAPCAMLGTPEDLQDFVAEAHGAGLRVYMCPSHEGAAWCDDGLPEHYFRYPTKLFGALLGRTDLLHDPVCMLDEVSKQMRDLFPTPALLLGKEAEARLRAIATVWNLDISAIEAKHVVIRRNIFARSNQAKGDGISVVSADFVVQQMRKQNQRHMSAEKWKLWQKPRRSKIVSAPGLKKSGEESGKNSLVAAGRLA